MLLRPDISSSRVALLQFLSANAARQALEDTTGVHVQLKWPNDLVVESGKLGGILIESKTIGDRVSFVVVGIGLNVNLRKTQLPTGAVSLFSTTGTKYDLRGLLKTVAEETESKYDEIDESSSILEEWWHNCIHRPLQVQVTLQERTLAGITRGIDEDGSLILETEDGRTQKVREGTLRVLHDSAN